MNEEWNINMKEENFSLVIDLNLYFTPIEINLLFTSKM